MSMTGGGYVPNSKEGAGKYGSTLGKQNNTFLDPVRDNIIEVVKFVPFPDKSSVFNIGDYGTADGASSMNFIRDLIVTLREHHGPEVQFQVICEDQEINDFNSLFRRLMGIIPDLPSYMLELDNVYPLALGINFRKQCVPSDSMHFIMSMIAVHWLSEPVIYKNCICVYPDGTEEETGTLKHQALMDWESFLLQRSKELKHGGVLLVASPAEYTDDNGITKLNLKIITCILNDVWRSFRDSRKITSQEFTNTNFATRMYTFTELKSPFDDRNSRVHQSGLRLLSAKLNIVKCVFYGAWKEKEEQTGVDDRQEFARSYVSAHMNWAQSTFMSGLSESRTLQEKEKIVDDLFSTVEKNICQRNPEEFKDDIILYYVFITKQ